MSLAPIEMKVFLSFFELLTLLADALAASYAWRSSLKGTQFANNVDTIWV